MDGHHDPSTPIRAFATLVERLLRLSDWLWFGAFVFLAVAAYVAYLVTS